MRLLHFDMSPGDRQPNRGAGRLHFDLRWTVVMSAVLAMSVLGSSVAAQVAIPVPVPQSPPPASPQGRGTPPATPTTTPTTAPTTPTTTTTTGAPIPSGYVIGPEDVLSIVFWREKDLSADVIVRPDGKISLPLLNDLQAAGYTPEQLGAVLATAAAKFVAEPIATVMVKEIHSRKVFVVGAVAKSGTVMLQRDLNVLQVIAEAGGLLDYADQENIMILRTENGMERRIRFNYKDVVKGKNTEQNILLKPGDTVLVR